MQSSQMDGSSPRRVGRRSLLLAGAGAGLLAATGCAREPNATAGAGRKEVEITILPAGGFGEVLDQQVFPPAYTLFQEKTGIKVTTLKVPENDIPDKLTTMVAGGTPPEGAYIHPQWVGSVVAGGW